MSECIVWWGTIGSHGYGVLKRRGKMLKAHRVIYEECFGPIPPETPWVLHRCDNPPCVNPEHLFLGTPDDNVQDMIQKGRAKYPGAPTRQFCVAGHEFTPENTGRQKQGNGRPGILKVCRECARRRSREHYQRKKLKLPK